MHFAAFNGNIKVL
jgi:ankyrin repeat protein